MGSSSRARRSYPAKQAVLQVETLRDFTTTWRVLPISGLAIVIGVGAAYVALALLRLIGFFTTCSRTMKTSASAVISRGT